MEWELVVHASPFYDSCHEEKTDGPVCPHTDEEI